jgi:signal transduction histidine kinase/ligand-binding sensor domain-containing protein
MEALGIISTPSPAQRRRRFSHLTKVLVRSIAAALGVFAVICANIAAAEAPPRAIKQYQSTIWRLKDGAPPDIWAIAQSPDGYLWLGTGAGLYRFDGVRFEQVQPSEPKRLPLVNITALMASPTGDIWIGYLDGSVSVLRGGHLTTYTGFDGIPAGMVTQFGQTPDGTLWATPQDGLARLQGKRWVKVGAESGITDPDVYTLLVARDGALWVTTKNKLFCLLPNATKFRDMGVHLEGWRSALAQSPDGRIWLSDSIGGTRALLNSGQGTVKDPSGSARTSVFQTRAFAFDHKGNLWGGDMAGSGFYEMSSAILARQSDPLAKPASDELFKVEDGLPSNVIGAVMQDREGNIWVGSDLGLAQFREPIFTLLKGLPYRAPEGYEALRSKTGEVYVASANGGDSTFYKIALDGSVNVVPPKVHGLLNFAFDDRGGLWLGTDHGLFYFDGRRLSRETLPTTSTKPQGVRSLGTDVSGDIWVGLYQIGVFQRDHGVWTHIIPRSDLPNSVAFRISPLRDGSVWLDMGRKGDALVHGRTIRFFGRHQTPKFGRSGDVDGTGPGVLFSSEIGLHWFDGQRFWTIGSETVEPFKRISGILRTPDGYIWLAGIAGIVRVRAADLYAKFTHPDRKLDYRLLDYHDGLPGAPEQDGMTSSILPGPGGRLLVQTSQAVVSFDPAGVDNPGLAPPVKILSLVADGHAYSGNAAVPLRAGLSNLQINYTALSLTEPDRVHFKYRLDGVDRDWVDAGVRRQAIYTRLGPGHYLFHVIAANSQGTWNSTGKTLAFDIPPTFFQTKLFVVLCILIGGIVIGLLFLFRVRQISDRLRGQLEERLAERERIARELHDTLLQGVQGLVLRFHSIARQTPPDSPTRPMMEEVLGRADEVIAQGRDRVQDLRITLSKRDLVQSLSDIAVEFPAATPELNVKILGTPRELHPMVTEEIASIGCEAIRNAFLHAKATHIDVALNYRPMSLDLIVADNGIGIDAALQHGREHHFGVVGMRERALKLRAEFSLESQIQGGTMLKLHVSGRVAYARKAWLAMFRLPSIIGA